MGSRTAARFDGIELGSAADASGQDGAGGQRAQGCGTGEDLDYTIKVTTNLVLVPVMVADAEGRLIGGLQPKDFNVLESGVPQKLKFFTSDPFPSRRRSSSIPACRMWV